METNLSTSNSSLSVIELAQKGAELVDPVAVAWTLLSAALFVIGFVFLRKLRPRLRYPAYFLFFVFLIRFLLLENVAAWGLYYALLKYDDIGFRQVDTISNEIKRRLRKPDHTRFLAVGSSQTVRLYKTYAAQNDDFETFGLAAMSTLDYMLYRDYIAGYRPENIVLYLSEFDLARMPNRDALKISPSPHLYWTGFYLNLRRYLDSERLDSTLKEMLIGEVFSEYKYSFIFRGLVDKLLGKNQTAEKKRVTERSADEWKEAQLKSIATLEPNALNVNIAFLEDFISFCRARDINVIITEGQYHPAGYTEENLLLNMVVQQRLNEVETRHDNARFIPRTELLHFSEEDYWDAVHVDPDAGYRFAERLRELVENTDSRS